MRGRKSVITNLCILGEDCECDVYVKIYGNQMTPKYILDSSQIYALKGPVEKIIAYYLNKQIVKSSPGTHINL